MGAYNYCKFMSADITQVNSAWPSLPEYKRKLGRKQAHRAIP